MQTPFGHPAHTTLSSPTQQGHTYLAPRHDTLVTDIWASVGIACFLQEGAHHGHPHSPGPGLHQQKDDFSARLSSCTGEFWQRGWQHALCWNRCAGNRQLLLKHNQHRSQQPPSSYAASTAKSKSCYLSSTNTTFNCCGKRDLGMQKLKATHGVFHTSDNLVSLQLCDLHCEL